MPEVNMGNVDEAGDFTPIPAGFYPAKITKIDDKKTHDGDLMWNMQLAVIGGEFDGRIIFDNLTFNEIGLKRIKLLCSRLGIDVSGKVNLTHELLLEKQVIIDVIVDSFTDKQGENKKKNAIKVSSKIIANSLML